MSNSVTYLGSGTLTAQLVNDKFTFETDTVIIEGYDSIDSWAFQYIPNMIVSITIGPRVESIGEKAFYQAINTASPNKPATVTFEEHSQLTSIGKQAFYQATNLISIIIPASVTSIGDGAFQAIQSLTSVTFEEGSQLTSIGAGAFQATPDNEESLDVTSNLTSIIIPSSVQSIGTYAFGSSGLTKVYIANNQLSGISSPSTNVSFFGKTVTTSNIYYSDDGTIATFLGASGETLTGANEVLNGASVAIIEGYNSIEKSAFNGATSLTSVTISASVTSIGFGAFELTSLTNIIVDQYNTNYINGFDGPGVLFDFSGATLIQYPIGNTESFYTINSPVSFFTPVNMTIADSAFLGASHLTTIVIPYFVTSIGAQAFWDTPNLKEVIFEDGFETGSKLTSIGDDAFQKSGITSITIPSSVETMGASAFSNSGLTSITFETGSKLTSIGEYAFYYTSFTSITIPAGVETIGAMAFSNSGLTSITFEAGSKLTSIGTQAFYNSGITNVLYNEDSTMLIYYPPSLEAANFEIPASVTSIGASAFQGASALTSITIPAGVTSIGASAFQGASALTSITIPAGVTSIGIQAFSQASNLTSVTFETGSKLNVIDSNAFSFSSLTSIIIPASVTRIGQDAFQFSDLTEAIISSDQLGKPGFPTSLGSGQTIGGKSGVNVIVYQLFSGTGTLRGGWNNNSGNSIAIIEGYSTIGYDAFDGGNMKSVIIGASVESIQENAFYNTTSLTSVTFEAGSKLNVINAFAFRTSALTSIIIPASTTTIQEYAFYNTTSLTSVTFEAGSQLRTIDPYAFSFSALESIIIPASVTTINNNAFQNFVLAEATINVDMLGKTGFPTSLGSGQTIGGKSGVNIIGYKILSGTRELTSKIVSENLNGANEVIIEGYSSIGSNAFNGATTVTSIVIPSTVTSIGYQAFFSANKLTDVNIPSSITSIGVRAFYGTSLTSITIPEGVTSIESATFQQMYSLTSISIPASVTSIGSGVFNWATSLTNITVNSSNTHYKTIDGVLFDSSGATLIQYNSGNTRISYAVPTSVTTIVNPAFMGAQHLTSITIPASVKTIGGYAFYSTTYLKEIIFEPGSQITSIEQYMFHQSGLSSITIPASVTSIGTYAFFQTENLTSITIPASVTSIGTDAFQKSGLAEATINVDMLGKTGFPTSLGSGQTIGGKSGVNISGYKIFSGASGEPLTPGIVASNLKGANEVIVEGYTRIGEKALANNDFTDTTSVISVSIGASVTSIGASAFQNAPNLTSVSFAPGSRITSIEESTFSGAQKLQYIVLPSTVTSIGENAFSGGVALLGSPDNDALNLQSVTTIGNNAFGGCTSLKTVLISQDNLTAIGYGAFSGCEDLINITLPTNSNYTSIEERTFQTCTSLLTINIPTNITSIGSRAFYGCNKLNTVNLNGGLTRIGDFAFEYCALIFMNFPPSITSIGTAAFMNNKIVTITLPISFGNAEINYVDDNWLKTVFGYSDNMKLEYYYIFAPIDPNSTTLTQTDVFTLLNKWQLAEIFTASTFNAYIADNVTIIDEYAFQNIKNLLTVSICSTLQEIKTGAFQSSGLQHFYVGTNYDAMPNSQLATIGNNVFSNCNNMTNILIPDNVTNLGDSVFYNSTNLSEVTFNANTKIESIGSFTFAYCVNLTILRIPNSIKTIGDYAFAYCNNLLDIVLPNSLNSIGNNAFTDCSNVTSLVVPYNVTDICNNAFENTNIPSTANVFISSKFKTNIDSIFYTQIFEETDAFQSALNNFNDNFETFNRWIWVKKGMTSIANSNMGSANHTLASQEGYFTPQNTAWWNWAVPELNADYELAKPSAIAWINNPASAKQGNVDNLNISQADWFISKSYRPLLNAKMILSNMPKQNQGFNSKIFNYHYVFTSADVSSTGTLTSDDVSKVIGAINSNFTVDIGDGITSIAASAFDGYNNKMSGLTISSKTITSIGANAFNGCSLLYGALYIPASVTEVGDSAFDGCTNINNIIIEEGKLNNIGTSAFSGTGILSIYIPKSVTSLGDNSFSKCQKMKTVILPLNVSGNVPKHSSLDKSNFFSTGNTSTITYQTFTMINPILSNGNYIITKQVVQDAIGSVEYQGTSFNLLITHTDPSANTADIQIETGAFQNMTNLYRLTMNNVSEIGAYAFSGCSKLQMVTIDNSIQTIGRNAFTSTNLLTVKIPSRMYNVCNSGYFTSTQPKLGGQPMYVFYCIFTTNQPSGILTNTEVYEQVGVDSSSPVGISITFDNTVQILNNNLFDGAKYISNINIPDNIEYIGDYAFANCTNLITLICSNTNPQLSQIGIDAFNGCTDLSMVHLPNSLLDIGTGAFLGCTSLWTVRLPRIFDFDLMTRSSNYFEALRTNEGANWKSDDPNNATGTFFTFDFSTMGAVGKYYSYSYQKSLYIYNMKYELEKKIEAHEKHMHFWDEVATIGIEVVVCAAVIVLTGGVASALAGETALGEGAAASEAGGGVARTTLGGLAVASTLSAGESNAKSEIEKLIDGGLFTGNLLSAASNTIMMDSLKNRTASYGSMIGIYTIPTTYLNNYYVVHTDGSWKITTTLTVSNSSIDLDTMINDYRQAIESFVNATEHIDILTEDIVIRAHHTVNNTLDHIYTLTATIPTDYDTVTDQHKSNVENSIKTQLISKHLEVDTISLFISDICFPKNTPIKTDQEIVYIENIDTHKHTINNKAIVAVTKTTSHDSYLVGFKKNSLGENYPSKDTVMSKEHKLMYNGKMYEAKKFLNKNTGVFKVKYNGEILYNILLDEHSTINVNNLVCETLHPNNSIAKFFKKYNNLSKKNEKQLVKEINKHLTDNGNNNHNNHNNHNNNKLKRLKFT